MSGQSFMLKALPALRWMKRYNKATLGADLMAAVIVTIMLIPQSLAYAMLAGLPPQVGLYASMVPIVLYGLLGTSSALAVGPVAVVSLLTAAAVSRVAPQGGDMYLMAAMTLALLSGLFLLLLGVLRLGFLANFLSHPVISGFITASGVIIAASQVRHIMGVEADGHTLVDVLTALAGKLDQAHLPTLLIGLGSVAFLFFVRGPLKGLLIRAGIRPAAAATLVKAGPVAAVALAITIVTALGLDSKGVAVVGAIPSGLPPLRVPDFHMALWRDLIGAAVLISVIGFVESVSVAQTLAARRRQRIDPNQELVALGAANLGAGVSGGYPVTGGFARSVVNFDAGAETPAAGIFTAAGIALATLFLTPLLTNLPNAVLAATIIVAVLSLVDFRTLATTWAYSRSDFAAMAGTIIVTWTVGVEAGVVTGVALSIALYLWRTSRPHTAIVGRVPGTEHYRNINRHDVVTHPHVLTLRVDEGLYFANARYLEDLIQDLVADNPEVRHVVLMCPAVNHIDASALESLEAINERLDEAGIRFHLSEVKGPVMDRLQKTDFLTHLSGNVFLSQYQAMDHLGDRPKSPPGDGAAPPTGGGAAQ
ncbi:SulP family inorganic anion transporter [Yunchengibacter salinarum]|uniref:SulP family inorganic anion transporter n=1 Tax=Yunchengibacter salinarum TaxID=3133399 RepID=UPI0035B60A51